MIHYQKEKNEQSLQVIQRKKMQMTKNHGGDYERGLKTYYLE
jgi:hypothetical protein